MRKQLEMKLKKAQELYARPGSAGERAAAAAAILRLQQKLNAHAVYTVRQAPQIRRYQFTEFEKI